MPIVPQPGEDRSGKRWPIWVAVAMVLAGIAVALVFTLR